MKRDYFIYEEEVCITMKFVKTVRITVIEEFYYEYMETGTTNNFQYSKQHNVFEISECEEYITKLYDLLEYSTINMNTCGARMSEKYLTEMCEECTQYTEKSEKYVSEIHKIDTIEEMKSNDYSTKQVNSSSGMCDKSFLSICRSEININQEIILEIYYRQNKCTTHKTETST